jgi:CDP-diacylglycerol--glycerol-3-phosphate 3-phosphatidyltransferase
MNLPNALTLSRIFFVPLLIAVMMGGEFTLDIAGTPVHSEWIALAIFLSAAITDFLDGYIARRRKQITTFGKLIDPIADKLLISAAFISLVELGRVPAWIVVLVVGREFAVSGLRYVALTQGVTIAASGLGKSKMVAQVVAVALLLIAPWDPLIEQMGQVAIFAVVVLTILSMYDYFRGFWSKVGEPMPPKAPGPPRPVPARER